MITVRRSNERGAFDHGWLQSQHTFSFAGYYDPEHMGFRSLRVINEDVVQPGMGFDTHPHNNMEIITYMISGSLAHKDSMGNVRTIPAGAVQAMSAGTGIRHSEYNPSKTEPAHLLQIWIVPHTKNLTPSYSEWSAETDTGSAAQLVTIASPDGSKKSITINQDASLHVGTLNPGQHLNYSIKAGRHTWLQMISGELVLGDLRILPGDGVATSEETELMLTGAKPSKFLLFDLA